MTDILSNDPPKEAPIHGSQPFLSWHDVQERLVEAMAICWRQPDRERGWQHLKAMWPEINRHTWFGDYPGDADRTERLRPAALTRREIADMEEAFGWLEVVKPDDRKLIGLALAQLASGHSQVSWKRLLTSMGMVRGSEGLRKRFDRAISAATRHANARISAADTGQAH